MHVMKNGDDDDFVLGSPFQITTKYLCWVVDKNTNIRIDNI